MSLPYSPKDQTGGGFEARLVNLRPDKSIQVATQLWSLPDWYYVALAVTFGLSMISYGIL